MAQTPSELDTLLSEAQLLLRDGYHDHLARAIAEARNQLTDLRAAAMGVVNAKDPKGDKPCP